MAVIQGSTSKYNYGFWMEVDEWVQTDPNKSNYYITANGTFVNVRVKIQNNGARTNTGGWYFYVYVNGNLVVQYDTDFQLDTANPNRGYHDTIQIAEVNNIWIPHEANGSKTIQVSAYLYKDSYYTTDPGYSVIPASGVSNSIQLTTIPRYTSITSFEVSKIDETNIRVNWNASNTCDRVRYRLKVSGGQWGSWVQPSFSKQFDIGGLNANTTYDVQISVRRQDSQLDTDSDSKSITTYPYPSIKSNGVPSFIIGNDFAINIDNQKSRSCTITFIGDNNNEKSISNVTGSSVSGFNTSEWITYFNNTLPNKTSGKYKIRLTCSTGNVNVESSQVTYGINTNDSSYNPQFTTSNIINVQNTAYTSIAGSNKFIKNHNKISGSITPMTPQKGSSGNYYEISSSNITAQRKNYVSQSNISFEITNVSSNSFEVMAVDSRGQYTKVTKQIDLVDYSNPSVNNASVNITRQNTIGDKAIVNISGYYTNWSGLLQNNSIQSIKYRVGSSGSFNALPSTAAITYQNGNWSLSTTLNDTFSTSSSYQLYFQVTDLLESSVFGPYTLNTADAFIWKDLANRRVGINKKPSCKLDVNGDIQGRDLLSTRDVLPTGQVKKNKTGSWISDRDNSPVANKNTGTGGGYAPACSVKTKNGNWTIGVIDNQDNLYFNYTTDTNYANSKNESTAWRLPVRGTNLNSTENLALLAYPVGSIYISAVNTNPGTIFGGTWVQLKNHFLFATNDTSGAKGKDSVSSHTGKNVSGTAISVNQMPSHNHGGSVSGGGHNHNQYFMEVRWASNYSGTKSLGRPQSVGSGNTNERATTSDGSHSHTITAQGGGQAHDHTVSSIEVYVWQRTA